MTNYQKYLTAQLIDAIDLLYDALLDENYEKELDAILHKDLCVDTTTMRICLTHMGLALETKMAD